MSIATRDRVLDVWTWCQEIYLQQGRVKLSFPRGTDPTKTYQYRYMQQLTGRLAEWEFDEPTSRRFIEIAVAYAQEKRLLHKGLALMCQGNLLDVALQRLEQERKTNMNILSDLERTHSWVTVKVGDREAIQILSARKHPDAHCNLVKWYGEKRLSDLYLALSASCGETLRRLGNSERLEVPSQSRLYLARLAFLQDKSNLREAKRIMGEDWR